LNHIGLHDHFLENPDDENLKKLLKEVKLVGLLDNDKSKKAIYDFNTHVGLSQVRLFNNKPR